MEARQSSSTFAPSMSTLKKTSEIISCHAPRRFAGAISLVEKLRSGHMNIVIFLSNTPALNGAKLPPD